MTHVSSRYVPALVVLLLLTGIPTLLHTSGRFDVDDCADPEALLVATLNGGETAVRGARSRVNHRWLERASATGEWVEGDLEVEGIKNSLQTLIIRSYDPKKLYHHPGDALVRGPRAEQTHLEWVESGSERLPIHRPAYPKGRPVRLAGYLLVYNHRPVSNPYVAQLLAVTLQLVTGRHPMTLFFVSGQVHVRRVEIAEQAMRDWLASEWRRYRSVCGAP